MASIVRMIVVETNTLTTNFCEALSNTGSEVDVFYGTAVTETDGDYWYGGGCASPPCHVLICLLFNQQECRRQQLF